MKVLVSVNNYEPVVEPYHTGWYFLADSAISNTSKPFYLSKYNGDTIVSLCLAVKINRLGKGLDKRFASRYYSEFAPALHFRMPDMAESLKKEGLPVDASRNFDKALMVGEPVQKNDFNSLELVINGSHVAEFTIDKIHFPIDDLLEEISELNTLKMGDILIPALCGEFKLKEGDFLEVKQNNEKAFQVRVK